MTSRRRTGDTGADTEVTLQPLQVSSSRCSLTLDSQDIWVLLGFAGAGSASQQVLVLVQVVLVALVLHEVLAMSVVRRGEVFLRFDRFFSESPSPLLLVALLPPKKMNQL